MPSNEKLLQAIGDRFLAELRHHLAGWQRKAAEDFSDESFQEEQRLLRSDPVYSAFGFGTPQYALIRLMGRVSISIGRRLGEIYDKIPRFAAQERFHLASEIVAPRIGGELELDVCLPLADLIAADRKHVIQATNTHLGAELKTGLGIEIRYNFNPNDSARLRKDVHMAQLLRGLGYTGVYLIFATISPREEAIARLKRAGWRFLVGDQASAFITDLIGLDVGKILAVPEVQKEITKEVKALMGVIYKSKAAQKTFAETS